VVIFKTISPELSFPSVWLELLPSGYKGEEAHRDQRNLKPQGAAVFLTRPLLAYFFLYPEGHFGLTAVTFLITLPLTQVIVLSTGLGVCGKEAEAFPPFSKRILIEPVE
jgi:hypothetical protein